MENTGGKRLLNKGVLVNKHMDPEIELATEKHARVQYNNLLIGHYNRTLYLMQCLQLIIAFNYYYFIMQYIFLTNCFV